MSELIVNAAVCEICGGKLVLRDENNFECESCGANYPKEWVRAKVQEIKGTVAVDNSSSVENLLTRAKVFFDQGDVGKAKKYVERILDIDANHTATLLLIKKMDLDFAFSLIFDGQAEGWNRLPIENVRQQVYES